MKKIRVGVVGAAGYTGGELIRILLNHPDTELVFAQSRSNSGRPLCEVHADLLGETTMSFSAACDTEVDVLFLCLGHGESNGFMLKGDIKGRPRIIDLSQDFRDEKNGFVYGLCEWNRERILESRRIANPGCFATAIQLALLPLVRHGLVQGAVHVNATTGSTGAGQSLSSTSHFSWRNSNVSVYKAFTHQHMQEIKRSVLSLDPGFNQPVHFIPQRGSFTRGIYCVLTLDCSADYEECAGAFTQSYSGARFVGFTNGTVDLKQVVNTNKCHIMLEKHNRQLMVVSAIDNLLKGASGQAVQNMNLMFGLKEDAGLRLKATAF